jgi:hypothetical protein
MRLTTTDTKDTKRAKNLRVFASFACRAEVLVNSETGFLCVLCVSAVNKYLGSTALVERGRNAYTVFTET